MRIIQSGKVLDFINGLLTTIDHIFDSLTKFDAKPVKRGSDGSVIYKIIPTGDDESGTDPASVVECKVKPSEDRKLVTLLFQTKDKKNQKKFEDIKNNEEDINKVISKYLDSVFDTDSFAEKSLEKESDRAEELPVEDCQKFSATLKKIVSGSRVDVQLVSIKANYAPGDVLSDIDMLLDNGEFVDELPNDSEASYEVVCLPDETLDVELVDTVDIDMAESLQTILRAGYVSYFSAMYERFNTLGPEKSEYRSTCNSIEWMISDQLNSIYGMFGELNLTSPFVPDLFVTTSDSINLLDSLQSYLDSLELYYCNVPHEIQAVIDKWMRDIEVMVSQLHRYC